MRDYRGMRTCTGTWLLGFGVGIGVGLFGPADANARMGLVTVFLASGLAFLWRRRQFGFFFMALTWGFFFNPPVLTKSESALRVKRPGTLLPGSSQLILSLSDGREYQAKAKFLAEVGEEGRIRCFKRSWFFEGCRFFPFFVQQGRERHPLSQAASWARARMLAQLSLLDRFERTWLKALVLGDESELAPSLREDFKRTGLYHLLVVSGFHFTVLCRIFEALVRGPFQIGYLVGLIRARSWIRLGCALRIVIVLCAFLYALLVGFQAPCQRALLGFAVTMLEPLFHGRSSLLRRIHLTASLQTLLFPGGFASVSNFLSWGAYVFVVAAFKGSLSLFQKILSTLMLQLKLLVLSFALIGKASLMGIIANALVAPWFPAVFVAGLLRLVQAEAPWTASIGWLEGMFVRLVRILAGLADFGLITASPRLQWVLFGASLWLFWQSLVRIQIPLEGRRRDCYPRETAFTKGRRYGKTLGRQDHPHRR